MSFQQRLLAGLEPWMTDSLATYVAAISTMFAPVDTLVMDVGVDGDPDYVPGWGALYDIDVCPTEDLPYLGQFIGVQVPTGADDPTARALVRAEAGISRGTAASIIAAAKRNTTGTQSVILQERLDSNGTTDAYQIVLGVLDTELVSLSALQNDVNKVKPAGILVNYVVTDFATWNEVNPTETWNDQGDAIWNEDLV